MSTEEALRDYILELERENKRLKIWLDQYEADATALIEEHGADPDDKIDREVLKRMLNCLIGKNRKLCNFLNDWDGHDPGCGHNREGFEGCDEIMFNCSCGYEEAKRKALI